MSETKLPFTVPRSSFPLLSRRMFLASSVPATAALFTLLSRQFPVPDFDVSGTPRQGRRVERIIYLYMSGGQSQVDLFDPKPKLQAMHGQETPPSMRRGLSMAVRLPLVGAIAPFARHGKCGMDLSTLLPHLGSVADEITLIRSVHTVHVNHLPAATHLLTGNPLAGRPSGGSWISYGLGSLNHNLPAFVVLMSGGGGQPLTSRYWHNGFLPGNHQGVLFRDHGDSVLYLTNPDSITAGQRRQEVNTVNQLNRMHYQVVHDPDIEARISAYELAFRMQASLPRVIDLATEPAHVLRAYGVEPGQSSFAANCLLARRLTEKGVRFIQLIHRDWDHHSDLPAGLREQCRLTDRPVAALLRDLKRLGLLDSTLVVCAGEFGRTPYSQTAFADNKFGRDHHPNGFSVWLAGGPVKQGFTFGATGEFGHDAVENRVDIHDLNATMLHCLGIDHEKLTFRHQGRDYRLTDAGGRVIHEILL